MKNITMGESSKKLLILAALVGISFAQLISVEDIRTSQGTREEADDTYGIVYGAVSCGGPGQFIHLHLDGCDTPNAICQIPVDNRTRQGFLEFLPSTDIEQIQLRILQSVDNGEFYEVINKKLPSSGVVSGVEARLRGSCRVPERLKGKMITIQHNLYNAENGAEELCVRSQYQIV